MLRYLAFTAAVLTAVNQATAELTVLRDSIGPDSSLTDGLPGGSTVHLGQDWATSALVLDVSEAGVLSEAQFVIFGRDAGGNPENDLLDFYKYFMEFHVWSDGIQGGPDSFYDNAVGDPATGHIAVPVNNSVSHFITVEEFGTTGPPADPSMFTTFLLTIDLTSFDIQLEGGQQYVAAVIDTGFGPPDRGTLFRVIGSRATGFEDLYQQFDTAQTSDFLPGFISSQLGNSFEQYAGRITIDTLPLPGDGNGDGTVDGLDYLLWAGAYGTHPGPDGDISDGDYNDDGWVDGLDYLLWAGEYGNHSAASVPEPAGAGLVIVGLTCWLMLPCAKRRRLTSRIRRGYI